MNVTGEYLIEVDGQERDKEAVRQFCATPVLRPTIDSVANSGAPSCLESAPVKF